MEPRNPIQPKGPKVSALDKLKDLAARAGKSHLVNEALLANQPKRTPEVPSYIDQIPPQTQKPSSEDTESTGFPSFEQEKRKGSNIPNPRHFTEIPEGDDDAE
jgi:hypothetical protein